MFRHFPSNTNENFRWILRAVRPWHAHILLLTLISSLTTIFSLWGAVCLRTLFDVVSSPDSSVLFHKTALHMIILIVLEISLSIIFNYYSNRMIFRIRQNLQYRLVNTLINKDFTSLRKKHTGEWMNRIVNDVSDISAGVVNYVPIMTAVLIRFTGVAWLLSRVSLIFLPVILLGIGGYVGMSFLMQEPMKQRQREMRNAQGQSRVFFTEVLSQMLVVKSFNREAEISTKAENLLENEFQYNLKRQNLTMVKKAIQDIGMKIPYILMIIFGAYLVLRVRISYGSLAMCARLLTQIREPVNQFSALFMNFPDIIIAAERLREAESYPDDPAGPVKSDAEIQRWYKDQFQSIVFRGVSFSYPDTDQPNGGISVFSHVDLTIPKQSVTAITGMTGSGKSTLFKLLMSIYPPDIGTKAVKTIDGAETELDASFRRLFAYVPQGNQLLTGTVREIVAFGDKEQMDNDEAIREALDAAGALEFVEKLPQGLDSQVKEKGMNLSEGQAQRLAIARAVFSRRPILLLDEATSALDEETERKLLNNLKAFSDCTILIVTHRPAAFSICDREFHVKGTSVFVRDISESSSKIVS